MTIESGFALKMNPIRFQRFLLFELGLDPDEGVVWNAEFQSMDKDKLPLRVMPNEIREIKENVEIDCFLNLAGNRLYFLGTQRTESHKCALS